MTLTQSSTRLVATAAGVAVALALMLGASMPTRAAALSQTQISSILNLLTSFGADATTLSNVSAALNGQATTGTTMTTTGGSMMMGGVCPFTWARSLQQGSTGTDVKMLQKFLNMDSSTMVSLSGAGSAGMETTTFGPATRMAVMKFQAKYGISQVGTVGPITRAKLNSLCTSNTTTTTTTTTTTGTGGTTTTVGNGPVSVMLASTQPMRTLIAGQAAAELGWLTFSGNGMVKQLKLQRTGISTDSSLDNVYLYDGNVRISDSASVVNGVITFNSSTGLFPVNGTKTISVRGDIATVASGNVASGNTIGFNVYSVTSVGGSEMTVSGVTGPMQSVSVLTNAATVNVTSAPTPSATTTTINAGTSGYTLYSLPLNVGTRSVNFKAITFKYTGSASTDALSNVHLFVDGTQSGAPAMWSTMSGNSRIGFDLSGYAQVLTTGAHTIELRADVVGGSNRNLTISLENRGDLVLEDSQVPGFNVGATYLGGNFTNVSAGQIVVNQGTLTITLDPNFGSTTKVVGGASNVTIGSFRFQSYGEDVKVTSLRVVPVLTSATGGNGNTLRNITLYANGGAIGSAVSTFNASTTNYVDFNLGSSLIIPAGQTVTVTVKADLMDSANVTYTGGFIRADLSAGITGNYQGLTSSQTGTTAAITSNNKTISSANVTFGVTSGFTAMTVSPNSQHVKIGSYTIQAGSAEGVTVTNIAVGISGSTTLTNLSNLTVTDGQSPVGQPTASNNFSVNYMIPANGSKTIDIYADLSTQTATVIPTVTISYRGATSNVNNVTAAVAGPTITMGAGTVAAPTFENSSPTPQYVVGGTTGLNLSNFKFVASGADVVIKRIKFSASTTNSVASVVVAGVSKALVGGMADVDGLNITVPVGSSGVVVPVSVNLAPVTSQSGNSNGIVQLAVTEIEYQSGSMTTILSSLNVNGGQFRLVGTKPTVSVPSTVATGLSVSGETKLGEVTIAADAAGDVRITQIPFSLSSSGYASGGNTISGAFLAAGSNGSVAINGSSCTGGFASTTCAISGGYTIAAGTSQTFSLRGTVTGSPTSGVKAQISTSVLPSSSFTWDDLKGNVTGLTGAMIYGYPTGSYTVTQ